MSNRAQQELESLANIERRGEASAANAAKLLEARTDFVAPSSGEASFALPEALATAVGAGWLLGPVGGVLLGAAQGILGKREEQAALDAFAQDTEVLKQTNSIFNDQFDRLALTAQSPEDLDQLSTWQTMKDAGMAMSTSPYQATREKGAAMVNEAMSGLAAYAETNEAQQIEAAAEQARIARELTGIEQAEYNGMIQRFNNESAQYEQVMSKTDRALNALAKGSPASLWAAAIDINKALDPESMVKEEEADRISAAGDFRNRLDGFLGKYRDGKSMSPEVRQDFTELLYEIRDTETRFQNARQFRYLDELEDKELPSKFRNNFDRTGSVPAASPGKFQVATLPSEDIDRAAQAAYGEATRVAEDLKEQLAGVGTGWRGWLKDKAEGVEAWAQRKNRK